MFCENFKSYFLHAFQQIFLTLPKESQIIFIELWGKIAGLDNGKITGQWE